MLHGGVERGREEEREAGLVERSRCRRRVVVDPDTKRVEDVGRARLRRDRPVPVLGDRNAGGRHHERRRGRDVERAAAVATRADDIDRARRARRRGSTRSRIAAAKPASSSTVSPRMRRPMNRAASWAGVASPSITAPMARRASSMASVPPSTTVAIAARTRLLTGSPRHGRRTSASAGVTCASGRSAIPDVANEPLTASSRPASPSPAWRRKFASRCGPSGVSTDLGVELDALERQRDVANAHDHAVDLAHRRHPQDVGERRGIHRQRVVAGGHERRRHALEQALTVVGHLRRLTVDERRRSHDRRTEASAIDCMPRHTPRSGIPRRPPPGSWRRTPASSGSPGPGEMTMPRRVPGSSASARCLRGRSGRCGRHGPRPRPPGAPGPG